MKLGKRFAAIGAAVLMSISMMSIGASASSSTWQEYNLHWTKGAPTSAIKTYQVISDNSSQKVFMVSTYQKAKMRVNITSFNANSLKSDCYVYDPTIGAWGLALTRTYNSTGLKSLAEATYGNAYVGNAMQIRLTLNYSTTGTNASSSGKAIAY